MRKSEHLTEFMPFVTGDKKPLWEGVDEEFAREVQDAFGIPTTINVATITPRVASGRAAVFLGGLAGAIVFVLENDQAKRTLHVQPTLMGPLSEDEAVIDRAQQLAAAGEMRIATLVMALANRILGPDGAIAYLTPEVH